MVDDILLDDILNNKAKKEGIQIPEELDRKINSIMEQLPERKAPKSKWIKQGILAAALVLMITAGIWVGNNGFKRGYELVRLGLNEVYNKIQDEQYEGDIDKVEIRQIYYNLSPVPDKEYVKSYVLDKGKGLKKFTDIFESIKQELNRTEMAFAPDYEMTIWKKDGSMEQYGVYAFYFQGKETITFDNNGQTSYLSKEQGAGELIGLLKIIRPQLVYRPASQDDKPEKNENLTLHFEFQGNSSPYIYMRANIYIDDVLCIRSNIRHDLDKTTYFATIKKGKHTIRIETDSGIKVNKSFEMGDKHGYIMISYSNMPSGTPKVDYEFSNQPFNFD